MKKISIYKQALSLDDEGLVISALDDGSVKHAFAIIHPIDQRRYTDYKTSRLRRRLIGFLSKIEASEGDFVKIDHDAMLYRISEIRRYERHCELEMEALI